jgi:hypothetical protein
MARAVRDNTREDLLSHIRQIAMRFELAFGAIDSPYKQFDMQHISVQIDDILLSRACNIGSKLSIYTSQLLPFGQTSSLTTAFSIAVR